MSATLGTDFDHMIAARIAASSVPDAWRRIRRSELVWFDPASLDRRFIDPYMLALPRCCPLGLPYVPLDCIVVPIRHQHRHILIDDGVVHVKAWPVAQKAICLVLK